MTATVYISGPMTGYTDWNRPAFARAAEHLRSKGYEVISPAELDEDMTVEQINATPHRDFLKRDIRVLLDCDLIYLLPGWKHSKGATLEAAVAKGCGIDELRDADVEVWRTFEGEPKPGPIETHAKSCDVEKGDGYGNEWCAHGEQVAYADAPERQPCDVVPIFGDEIGYIVDDSMPPNTLRIEHDAGHVDFEVSWDAGEMTLARKAAEAEALDQFAAEAARQRHSGYQPGDKFPNVAYVRDMTGVTASALADNVRRLAVSGMSVAEVAEAVNAQYVASADGRGSE